MTFGCSGQFSFSNSRHFINPSVGSHALKSYVQLILLTFLSFLFQQGTNTISPDKKFNLTIEKMEESDLQTRYIARLTDNVLNETIKVVNCVRRDLSASNFYWDNESK